MKVCDITKYYYLTISKKTNCMLFSLYLKYSKHSISKYRISDWYFDFLVFILFFVFVFDNLTLIIIERVNLKAFKQIILRISKYFNSQSSGNGMK